VRLVATAEFSKYEVRFLSRRYGNGRRSLTSKPKSAIATM